MRQGEIRRLALALRDAARALATNRAELATIADDLVPGLLNRPGIGPVSAAQAIVSFSHAGRCRSDAAFAKLAGTSPIEASSGQTTPPPPHLEVGTGCSTKPSTIATTRIRTDPAARAYLARRRAEGKSDREIRRCLKRYITRQLFRALTAALIPEHCSQRLTHAHPSTQEVEPR